MTIILGPSAHVDTFARDHLPPGDQWPTLEFTLPELQYPARLNAALELLDGTIERFGADRAAVRLAATDDAGGTQEPGGTWTYGRLRDRVDQVARLLVEDHGLVPGNRVLLRIPNNVWAVIAWLAVLKAGGIVITTMVAWPAAELAKVTAKTTTDSAAP